jgi:PAS domain S-box-containing protein
MKLETKILLVEHDKYDIELIEHELKKGNVNYKIEIVRTAEEYEYALTDFKPDIILSDYTLPSFSGPAAFKLKESITPYTPFIYVSGTIGEENSIQLIRNGATDFVLKDKLYTLVIKVNRALKEAKEAGQHKKAEAEVIKAYKETETVLNRINDSVVSVDNEWRYTFLNDAALATHPMSKQETIGKVIWDIHPEMKNTIFWHKYHEAMQTGKVVEVEDYYAPMKIWFSAKAYPSSNGLTIFYKDITQRKKADNDIIELNEKLLATNRELSIILNTLPATIALLDKAGTIIAVNEAWKQFALDNHMHSATHGLGDNYIEVCEKSTGSDKEYAIEMAMGLRSILNGDVKKFALEYPCHAPGEERWFNAEVRPFKESKNSGAVVMHINITERKKTAQVLTKTLKEVIDYRFALDEAAIVAITDHRGVIKHVNDNFCTISQYSKEELIGHGHRIVNSGYHSDSFIQNIWNTIAGGKVWRNEIKNKAKDGSYYWVDITIVPFLNEMGEPYQYVAIQVNITAKKEAEIKVDELIETLTIKNNELHKTNIELDKFVYSTSHDLRAPLLSLLTLIEMCGDHKGQQKELNNLYAMMTTGVNRVDETIKNILNYSRNARTEIKVQELDIKEISGALIETLKHIKSDNKIAFTVKIENGIPFYSDKARVTSIINNLLSNAIKYQRANEIHPTVQFTFSLTETEAHIIVEDNGEGIPMNMQSKIFEMFERTSSQSTGSGLGLYICREMVNKLGGDIQVISERFKGSIFIVRLPNLNPHSENLNPQPQLHEDSSVY